MDMNSEQLLQELQRGLDAHEVAALMHVAPLTQQLLEDPAKAISAIQKTYDRALDEAYSNENGQNWRGFIETTAGGPFEHIPWQVYNAIGSVYPALSREQRDSALRQILDILDVRNYLEVNGGTSVGHTTGIREPLLLGDIVAVRPLYWPGLEEQIALLKNYSDFDQFSEEMMDVNGFLKPKVVSDFLLAYTLLRKPEWNESYAKFAETFTPRFLERTITAIAAVNFSSRYLDREEERKKRLHELLPQRVHVLLDQAREKKDWADYHLFT
ncbi:MAG: hypothetical protein V1743_00025 [Nanoarchaeota archaeon]